VRQVAFVSGTLVHPALRAELERHMRTWRLGPAAASATISMTLLFS
jgi:hypothetical protein